MVKSKTFIKGYHTLSKLPGIRNLMTSNKLGTLHESPQSEAVVLLNPDYVTGFSDAESCFFIHLTTGTTRVGWAVKPVFCIELHIKDLELIKAIQNYFGVGIIQINQKRNTVYFSVQSVKDVVNSVIPHFDKYPLITQKRADYLLWKKKQKNGCINDCK